MDFFGSLLNDESQNNFDFLKELNQAGKDKKTNFSNSFLNFTGTNMVNNTNNMQNPSFFSQSNSIPQYNSNYIYTPINNNQNNYALPQSSNPFQETSIEENYLTDRNQNHINFSHSLVSDTFDMATYPHPNNKKISNEFMDNLKEFEEMFKNQGPKQNQTTYHTKNNKKELNKNSEGTLRQNYRTIVESDEEEERLQTFNQINQVNHPKENLEKEVVRRYGGNAGEIRINKRTRGEARENPVRVNERTKVESELPEQVRKEYPSRMNFENPNLNYSNDAEQVLDNPDDEIIKFTAKNSKKFIHDLNKNEKSHQLRNDLSTTFATDSMDGQAINVNINQKVKKSIQNVPNEQNRMNDPYQVEKTKKNNKKVSLFTDKNARDSAINGFSMDHRMLSNQLQEKKEKLKMMNNLTKYHEKLYSKIEDFKKKVPLFIEKYLENYQKHLENYKLMITLNDDEIDNLLGEYNDRMDKIKEKFKF